MYVVKQAFNTPSRRFAVGQPVTRSDLTGPVPVNDWLDRGYIEVPKPAKGVRPTDSTAAAAS